MGSVVKKLNQAAAGAKKKATKKKPIKKPVKKSPKARQIDLPTLNSQEQTLLQNMPGSVQTDLFG